MLRSVNLEEMSEELIPLYESSFSDVEKIPLGNIRRTIGRGGSLKAYYDDDSLIGMTFGFIDDGKMFFVYFATVPEVRGKGYGSEILDMVRQEYGGIRIFLVVEPCDEQAPDHQLRVRRQEFYRRNGCVDTGIKVISDDEWFDTMFIQGTLTEKEMVNLIRLYEDMHNGRQ
jgi:GNAT superfamily N-acetyltransferase